MPFDPQLIREDDSDFSGELKLPDDFALMAEQLSDDAARLAAAYPPPTLVVTRFSGFANRLKPVTTNKWLTRSFAGTALAIGLVAISLVAMNANLHKDDSVATPSAPSPIAGPAVDLGGKPLGSYLATNPPSSADPKIPVTPASYLGDASGPELEALMDLWEQDQPAVRSLSF
jgi:hypothetical protein